MSRRGENIYKRQDGRWEAVLYIKARCNGGAFIRLYLSAQQSGGQKGPSEAKATAKQRSAEKSSAFGK
jgi:hypothetical protein